MDDEVKKSIWDLPGIKEQELVDLGPCRICGKKLFEGSSLVFYRVQLSQCAFDANAIRRRIGFGMQMGSDKLARAMGADEDLAKITAGPSASMVHGECAGKVAHLMLLMPRKVDGI